MAVKKWVGGGGVEGTAGKWSEAKGWNPEVAPVASSEVEIPSGSGSLEINTTTGKCKQIIVNAGYANKITASATAVVTIGTTTASGTAIKLVSGSASLGTSAEFKLSSTSAGSVVEKITSAGNELPRIQVLTASGKYQLADAAKVANFELVEGSFDTNGQSFTCLGSLSSSNANTRTVTLGASTVICEGGWTFATTTGLTFEAGTSTIEMVAGTFQGGGLTYHNLTITNAKEAKVEQGNTFATVAINNKAKDGACKGTILIAKPKELTVTAGGPLANGEEVRAKGIPQGTTIVKKVAGEVYEMSKEATEEIKVAEEIERFTPGLRLEQGKTQTVTSITTNGKEKEHNRLWSGKAGEAAKVKSASVIETEWVVIRDITFEGTGEWYAPNSIDAGGNTNIKFEAKGGTTTAQCKTKVSIADSIAGRATYAAQTTTKVPFGQSLATAVRSNTQVSAQVPIRDTAEGRLRASVGATATFAFADHASVIVTNRAQALAKLQFTDAATPNAIMQAQASAKIVIASNASARQVQQAVGKARLVFAGTANAVATGGEGPRHVAIFIFLDEDE